MGGLEGRGCDMAVHTARMLWQATEARKASWGVVLLDLVSAFDTTIRQLALKLPGTEDELEEALVTMPIPPVLLEGVKAQLNTIPIFDQNVDNAHLLAVLRDAQRGNFWRVSGAWQFVAPRLGSRPGSVPAADVFNVVFARVHQTIEDKVRLPGGIESELGPPPLGELSFASASDVRQQDMGVSFVDDLTQRFISKRAADLMEVAISVLEAV
eukprot:7928296-Pyramimonas_sp.AAC.1